MRIFRLVLLAAIPLTFAFIPFSAPAQQQSTMKTQMATPTPAQVKAAVKDALVSANLTLEQKRKVKGMVQSYESQTATADDATKKAAQKTLLKNIYGILTPAQQAQFKASIKQSLNADMQ